jgi:hypothetical protein
MLSRANGLPEDLHHLSIQRALLQLGLRVPAAVVFLLVTALGCGIAYAWAASHEQRVAIALAFSALAVPVVNPNTLLLTLPLQALALDRMAARWRLRATNRRAVTAEIAIVVAATVGVHGALGTVALHNLPGLAGGLLTLIPHAEVVFLALYALMPMPAEGAPLRTPRAPAGVRGGA